MLPWFSLSWTGSADKNGLHQINSAPSVPASSRYHQMFSSTPNHTSRLGKMDIQGGTPCRENTWEVWGCWVLGRNPSGLLSSSFRVCKMKVMILAVQGSFYVYRPRHSQARRVWPWASSLTLLSSGALSETQGSWHLPCSGVVQITMK